MKKFIKCILAFAMVLNIIPFRTVRAEDAEKTVKVEVKISSDLKDGNNSVTTVSGEVYDDYSFHAILPDQEVYAENATVYLRMKDISSLNIVGEREMTYTINTGLETRIGLYQALKTIAGGDANEHLFHFEQVKLAVAVNAHEETANTVYTVKGSGYTPQVGATYDGTPDSVSSAKNVWKLLTDQLTADTKENPDSYVIIAKDSYLQLGNQKLVFQENEDLKLDNFSDPVALVQKIRKYLTVENAEDNAVVLVLRAGTRLDVGQSYAVLDTDAFITIGGIDVGDLDILSTLRDVDSNNMAEMIRTALAMMNTLVGLADDAGELSVEIDFAHEYKTEWNWSEDKKSAFVYLECEKCDHSKFLEAVVDEEVTDPTCTEDGNIVYVATAVDPDTGKKYTDTHPDKVVIPANGHTPKEAVKENETVNDCEIDGGYDTVVYCNVCGAEISREHVVIPATGHDWSKVEYSWSEDNKSVTASIKCENNHDHDITETVSATYAVTLEPTCTETGKGLWTSAEFESEHFEVQTKEVTIPADDHD